MCQLQGIKRVPQKKYIHSTFRQIAPSILHRLNLLRWCDPGSLAICALLGVMPAGCTNKSPPGNISTDNRGYAVDRTHPSASQNERVRILSLHYISRNIDESLKRSPVSRSVHIIWCRSIQRSGKQALWLMRTGVSGMPTLITGIVGSI